MTSKSFSLIYDWMISSQNDSYHLLQRDNILEIFTTAQYLGIKGKVVGGNSFEISDHPEELLRFVAK